MAALIKILPTNIISLLLAFLVIQVRPQCLTENDQEEISAQTDPGELYRGEQAFTLSMLSTLNKATPNNNIFFSPYSTYHALLLAYFGAKNHTEKELRDVLHLNWAPNKNRVMRAYHFETRLREKRAKNSDIEFQAADKIFISKEAELRECLHEYFNNELETLNFSQEPEICRQHINKWVENVTKNEIKDILKEGDVDAETKIILANAAYFKGKWAKQFDPANTKKEIFYTSSDKHTFVDMMFVSGTFGHVTLESLGANVLELPYLGEANDISMLILLPPFNAQALENVLNRLNPDTLGNAYRDLYPKEVEIKLPKFTFEKTLDLVPVLTEMGLSSVFSETSNFSGFSTKQKLTFGDARHKAKIQVDEEGSTAAAASVVFQFRSARAEGPVKFTCDHPFIFVIYDRRANAILFTGIYRGPDL